MAQEVEEGGVWYWEGGWSRDGLTMAIPYFSEVTLPLAGLFAIFHDVNHPAGWSERDLGQHLLGVVEVNCQDHLLTHTNNKQSEGQKVILR